MLILQSEMYSKVLDTDHLRTQDHIDMSIHQKGQGSPSNNECMKCHHELRLADVLCITETHFHRFSPVAAGRMQHGHMQQTCLLHKLYRYGKDKYWWSCSVL